MPTYEYECNRCRERYTLFVMRMPREAEKRCPYCNSEDVRQVPAPGGGVVFGLGDSCTTSSSGFG